MSKPRFRDLTGQKFGRWTAMEFIPGGNHSKWKVRCDCGNEKQVLSDNLTKGKSRSCGCLNAEMLTARATHGHSVGGKRTRTFNVWRAMISRCGNPKTKAYPNYGGRGIYVCERWKSFPAFVEDMGISPDGLQIDRIDNEKGYSPENCRWVTPQANSLNRRSNHRYFFNGESVTLKDISKSTGMSEKTIATRLALGWSEDKAFTTPVRRF